MRRPAEADLNLRPGFPSRFQISEEYLDFDSGGGIRFMVSKTTVTYKEYKFFAVETEVGTIDRR